MTGNDLKQKAILLAIGELNDVVYRYEYADRTMTLDDAKKHLPQLAADTVAELEYFRNAFNRQLSQSPLLEMGDGAVRELKKLKGSFNSQLWRTEKRLKAIVAAMQSLSKV